MTLAVIKLLNGGIVELGPDQFYRPGNDPTIPYLLLEDAASGTPTGTSATTNAADTSSASGTTTVVGTSARTNANDTSTASGTTTVVGTSATTNAADTSSASGTVGGGAGVSGTSATTNANDTSSASGTTTVVGTSATTNAADTSTASGTTTVTGTSTTTNANDTATASGAAGSITGTSATTNANDVASASGSGGPVTASTGAGRSKRRQDKRPVVVEIDGEDFVVNSEEEAVALLDKAKEQAEQLAQVQIARAAKAERRKTGKVIADARKTLVVPQIKAPGLESYAAQVLADIRDTYASTMRTIEVAALLRKRDREEEDDEDVLLLLL